MKTREKTLRKERYNMGSNELEKAKSEIKDFISDTIEKYKIPRDEWRHIQLNYRWDPYWDAVDFLRNTIKDIGIEGFIKRINKSGEREEKISSYEDLLDFICDNQNFIEEEFLRDYEEDIVGFWAEDIERNFVMNGDEIFNMIDNLGLEYKLKRDPIEAIRIAEVELVWHAYYGMEKEDFDIVLKDFKQEIEKVCEEEKGYER